MSKSPRSANNTTLMNPESAFVHKRDCNGVEFSKGQAVSFVIGDGPKGAAAKKVQAEEGGTVAEAEPEEEEGERQLGKVKVIAQTSPTVNAQVKLTDDLVLQRGERIRVHHTLCRRRRVSPKL